MKPTLALEALSLLLSVQEPAFLSGAPGIGKSSIVKQYADKNDLQLMDLRAVLLDPVDLRGLPMPNGEGDNQKVKWIAPEFLPTEGRGILFLDELNAAPRLVQSACLQLTLDRSLGEYTLPDGWQIVAAGNRETDGAGVGPMITPLADRFTHVEVEADLDDWCLWAIDNPVPAELIAFLRFRPELLSQDPSSSEEKVFPSPRSWATVAKILEKKPSKEIEFQLYSGRVGEGPATELIAYLEMCRELPNPDAIFLNPQTSPVPEKPCALFATVTCLASRANSGNVDALIQYAERLPQEFQVCLVRDSLNRNSEIANSHAFIGWASRNDTVFC